MDGAAPVELHGKDLGTATCQWPRLQTKVVSIAHHSGGPRAKQRTLADGTPFFSVVWPRSVTPIHPRLHV